VVIATHPNQPTPQEQRTPNKLVLTHPHEALSQEAAAPAPIVSSIETLDDAHFDAAVKRTIKGQLIIIEYYASWCGTCKEMAPVIEALAKRHPKVKLYRIDVDDNPKSVDRCDVKLIPTLASFSRGALIGVLIGGGKTAAALDQFVEQGSEPML
jgi:thioredoxin 1